MNCFIGRWSARKHLFPTILNFLDLQIRLHEKDETSSSADARPASVIKTIDSLRIKSAVNRFSLVHGWPRFFDKQVTIQNHIFVHRIHRRDFVKGEKRVLNNYQQTYQYLQENVSATENNRYYIGLMNEVDEIKKNEGLEDFAALQKAFNNIAEADKNRAEGTEPVLPRVIEGYNAVQALKPSNKLLGLTPMLPQIADLILRAKNLPNEVKAALSRDPFKAVAAIKSAKNVLEQLYHTQKMAQYIKMQYDRNQEMKKYMQE